MQRLPLATTFVTALILGGCGGGGYDLVPVSGIVSIGDEPVENARVAFEPMVDGDDVFDAGPGSYGVTGADGRFTLATTEGHAGAVTGRHRVHISTLSGEIDPKTGAFSMVRPEVAPPQFQDGSVVYRVSGKGTDQAMFDLSR